MEETISLYCLEVWETTVAIGAMQSLPGGGGLEQWVRVAQQGAGMKPGSEDIVKPPKSQAKLSSLHTYCTSNFQPPPSLF